MGAVHPALRQTGEMVIGAFAGAALATFAKQAIVTSFPTMPTWAGGAVPAVAGAGILMFVKPSPLITGAAIGMAGMGGVFMLNETFLSLPGISGMPTGVTNAAPGPGYISKAVNGYMRNLPPRTMGTFSGSGGHSVNGVYSN